MKSIVMFALGAALAAGVVLFVMKRDSVSTPAPTETAQTAIAAQPVATQPAASPLTPEAPAASALPEPQAAAAGEAARKAPLSVRKPSQTARRNAPAPAESGQPVQTQPQQTAQVTPPVAPPQAPVAAPEVTPSPMPVIEEKKPEPRVPKTVTIPAGTLMTVRLDEALSTDKNQTGDSFRATLDSPVVVDGFVIAERGSRVEGRVAEVDRGGRVRGLSQLALELVRLNTSDGQRVKLETETFTRQGEKSVAKDAAKIGAAAGIGAAIGAIAGGGKGAAIGAAVGGAAGTGGIMATRGKAAQLPAETRVSFRLSQPITITEKL